jgi:hypothetical protein
VLAQIVHVEVAMLLEPVLVGLDRQCPQVMRCTARKIPRAPEEPVVLPPAKVKHAACSGALN